ncbi:MAG: DMT family transporter, partial [Nanoarchaeota archaeon]|nr:DMT family transporter [Nanoarchaeota archaeon]
MANKTGYIYLILTILLWSATPAVAKLALGELSNYQLLFYTSIIGVISLFLVNLFQGKLKTLRNYSKKDYFVMFGIGVLGIFLYYIFLYGSFAIAPAGQVNVMNYLWPVFIVIFSIPLLKEKFNYKTILAILVSFFGALIAFTKGNFLIFSNQYALGYLLAALGAVCYGLFSVLGKKLEYEKFSSMLIYYISSAILIIPTSIIISGFVIPKSLTTIISILVLGGVMNSIAFVFWFKALKLGDTHKTANYIYVVPFLAMVWTYLLNSEPFAITS